MKLRKKTEEFIIIFLMSVVGMMLAWLYVFGAVGSSAPMHQQLKDWRIFFMIWLGASLFFAGSLGRLQGWRFKFLGRNTSSAERKRERIGSFIITSEKNFDPEYITCAMCEKKLSHRNSNVDTFSPGMEELTENGAVPVPNFGWFCSQHCASAYEKEFGVRFDRNTRGEVQYY